MIMLNQQSFVNQTTNNMKQCASSSSPSSTMKKERSSSSCRNQHKHRRRSSRPSWIVFSFSMTALTVASLCTFLLQQKPCMALATSVVPQRRDSVNAVAFKPFFPFLTEKWFLPDQLPRGGGNEQPQQQQQQDKKRRSIGEPILPFLPYNRDRQRQLEEAYQKRKDDWVAKYTTVEALRRTFGTNRNGFWGDLDARTARRLYKTLLPRALLELYKMGVRVEDLAPLAYQARVAAKLYARERCTVPGRVAAELYDGIRQFRKYGTFDTSGMTYEQIWNKYASLILEEYETEECFTEQDVTAKICLKILERSCQTNEQIDKLVKLEKHAQLSLHDLHANNEVAPEIEQDLVEITLKLEKDVRELLDSCHDAQPIPEATIKRAQRFKTLRLIARARQRIQSRNGTEERSKRTNGDDDDASTASSSSSSERKDLQLEQFPWHNRPKPWEQRYQTQGSGGSSKN